MKILVTVEHPQKAHQTTYLWQRLTIEVKHYNDLILG